MLHSYFVATNQPPARRALAFRSSRATFQLSFTYQNAALLFSAPAFRQPSR